MSDPEPGTGAVADSWDTYWHGAERKDAYTGGGSGHPAVHAFWNAFFLSAAQIYDKPRVIDIAGGNGAVIERARETLGERPAEYTCVDISASAIKMLGERIPNVRGVVADARDIPLDDSAYDVVASQFGMEYAGLDSIDEMMRLVADGGRLAMLLHHRNGGIYRQCAASVDALRQLEDSKFIPLSVATFETGFAACRGGDRGKYEAAAKLLVPAIRAVESIMAQHSPEVADGTIRKLYKDVATVHDRLPHYEPSEVLAWLGGMQVEVLAYAGRMASMCDAAIDEADFNGLCERVENHGFELVRNDALMVSDRNVALAWALIARRR